uniref:Reverse transcriptase domain-containing protein n=1 Tax=Salarias fasciatus TaxID=181472 RepID=A0A672J846_SALFA
MLPQTVQHSWRYDLTLLQALNHAKVIWDAKSKPKGLLGGHLNIRSIASKPDQVEKLLTGSNLDFICLSETWLKKTSPPAAFYMSGYKIFRRDRSTGKGGELLFYVRENLECKQIHVQVKLEVEIECIAITINLSPQMSFILVGIYRPPSSDVNFYISFKEILRALNTLGKEVIVLGDFNINWTDKNNRKKLKEITSRYNFEQLINGPTRVTKTTKTQIDLIFSNKPDRIIKSFIFVTGMSDHNLVLIARKLNKNRFSFRKNEEVFYGIPIKDWPRFDHDLQNEDWNALYCVDETDTFCKSFLEVIKNVKDKYLKKCSFLKKKAHVPWLTSDIWKLMRRRDYLLKKALKSSTGNDMHLFKDCRNKVVKELRTAKTNFFIDLITQAKGNNHLIWKHINNITRKEKGYKNYEIKINNMITDNESNAANAFNGFFKDSVNDLVVHFGCRTIEIRCVDLMKPVLRLSEVSQPEVLNILQGLNSSKAQDVYGFDSCMIKRNATTLCQPITTLINRSIRETVFPDCLKKAVVIPLHKGGDQADLANYRPVSILPAISKVVEKVVATQLMDHLNYGEHPLNPLQFGFRKYHSTETAVCYFVEQLKGMLDKGGAVGAIFLDLKKAFDTVNHNILMTKLSSHNISTETLDWFKSYLKNRKHCTRIKSTMSSFLDRSVGVPQGSVLGPLLFSVYINDLPAVCPEVHTQMYADDAVLYVHAKTSQRAAALLQGACKFQIG